jgi:hypothetical protein
LAAAVDRGQEARTVRPDDEDCRGEDRVGHLVPLAGIKQGNAVTGGEALKFRFRNSSKPQALPLMVRKNPFRDGTEVGF